MPPPASGAEHPPAGKWQSPRAWQAPEGICPHLLLQLVHNELLLRLQVVLQCDLLRVQLGLFGLQLFQLGSGRTDGRKGQFQMRELRLRNFSETP